jgi:hypothetical protein
MLEEEDVEVVVVVVVVVVVEEVLAVEMEVGGSTHRARKISPKVPAPILCRSAYRFMCSPS